MLYNTIYYNKDALDKIFKTYKVLDNACSLLNDVFTLNNVSVCHGIEHAKQVMYHAFCALQSFETDRVIKLTQIKKEDILLAALLHDADDAKFFPEHNNCENVRTILQTYKSIENVVNMIKMVSSSKNGDNIPYDIIDSDLLLIPRYADRLEALGLIGVDRCYTYNKTISKPLYIESTPKPTTEEDIWKYATIERYKAYRGYSASMIDHYYDKLLHLNNFPITNSYFTEQCLIRQKPLIELLLLFGRTGTITNEQIETFIKDSIK